MLAIPTTAYSQIPRSSTVDTAPSNTIPLTREKVLQRVNEISQRGVPVDGLRRGYNLLLRRILERYPQASWILELAQVVPHFDSDREFSRSIIFTLLNLDLESIGLTPRQAQDALRLAARWLDSGALPLAEMSRWHLLSSDSWRTLEELSPEHLNRLLATIDAGTPELAGSGARGQGGRPNGRRSKNDPSSQPPAGATEETQPNTLPRGAVPRRLEVSPPLLAGALIVIEDFLRSYDGHPMAPCTAAEQAQLTAASLALLGRVAPPSIDRIAVDPGLAEGLRALFRDLSREVFGLDPAAVHTLVQQLPEDQGWALAMGGYGVRAGEPLGLPFMELTLDVMQLALGQRVRVVWLDQMQDLERLLTDSTVRRLAILGHGSSSSYSFEGLTGPPVETLSKLLMWAQGRVVDLAPAINQASQGRPQGLADLVNRELPVQWRRWSSRDNQRLLQGGGFAAKEEIVVYACCVNELLVKTPSVDISKRLLQQLRKRVTAEDPAGEWISCRSHGAHISVSPSSPAQWRAFQEKLPKLLALLQRDLGLALQVELIPDFTVDLAEVSGRFPGVAWIHDYLTHPHGMARDREALLRRTHAALKLAPRTGSF